MAVVDSFRGLSVFWPFLKEVFLGDVDLYKAARKNRVASIAILLCFFFFVAFLWATNLAVSLSMERDRLIQHTQQVEIRRQDEASLTDKARYLQQEHSETISRLETIDSLLKRYQSRVQRLRSENQRLETRIQHIQQQLQQPTQPDEDTDREDKREGLLRRLEDIKGMEP